MHVRTVHLGIAASLAALLAAVGLLPPAAASPTPTRDAEAMQQIADVVLIESECRAYNIDYGALFAFAGRNGIEPADIMPAGPRRAAFDAAYRRRAREIKGTALCETLAAERGAAIPGVLTPR